MKRIIAFLFMNLILFTGLKAQIINLNPDKDGDPWYAGGIPEMTPEMEAYIDALPVLELSPEATLVELPSSVDNSQNIYLGSGIYADPTLWYEKGAFQPYPYSFPDFKTGLYDKTFLHIRALFKGQRRKLNTE